MLFRRGCPGKVPPRPILQFAGGPREAEPGSKATQYRGIGLGLYLARLMAQAYGGILEFRNARLGLEAILWLPRRGAAV